jgi:hypothetical protein
VRTSGGEYFRRYRSANLPTDAIAQSAGHPDQEANLPLHPNHASRPSHHSVLHALYAIAASTHSGRHAGAICDAIDIGCRQSVLTCQPAIPCGPHRLGKCKSANWQTYPAAGDRDQILAPDTYRRRRSRGSMCARGRPASPKTARAISSARRADIPRRLCLINLWSSPMPGALRALIAELCQDARSRAPFLRPRL